MFFEIVEDLKFAIFVKNGMCVLFNLRLFSFAELIFGYGIFIIKDFRTVHNADNIKNFLFVKNIIYIYGKLQEY
mgnify:CR=1 FL=1